MPTVVVTHFRLNFSQRRDFRLLPAFFCLPRLRISRYNSVLNFFTFPADKELRRKLVVAIRRDIITPHNRVCSLYFNPEDLREPASKEDDGS
ncbi:hypothetical protein XENOCAPTIV_015598 [Xenoophorus captivus]|uniref:THAP-type domain-containing protein n=1 Tax=Xenoophorus captivus TaxID=1517983 RepID=A0ABV0QJ73_9TELE